ncbi:MAG TPA: oligosaccharide flippase family protein [Candidatus Udaeobacter sp.]|nr:oligosaccharide flippase family protein [Candidatus Udaeobacter sp.]
MSIIERIKLILQKRALQQTSYVFFGSLVNGASLFTLNIILARVLSVDFFAIFSLSVLALSTVAEVSDFGLNSGLLRFAPYYISTNQTDKLKQLVKTIWSWRVWLTWILTIGGIALSYPGAKYIFGQAKIYPYLMYSFLGIGGVVLLGFLTTFLQSKQRFFYQASVQSLKGFLRLVIVIILAVLGVRNLFAYLSVYIFVPWILFISNYKVFPENFRKVEVDPAVKNSLHSQLAKFSFWLSISSVMSIFATRVDSVVISHFLGLESVAVYSAAYLPIQFFPLVYNSIGAVLTPKLSAFTDKKELISFFIRTLKWVSVAFAATIILIVPSKFLIPLFFGQKYISSMPVYLILASSLALNILSTPFSIIITIFNQTRLVFVSALLGLLINIIGNVLFVPRFGVMGSAYTFALGVIFSLCFNIVCALYLFKKRDLVIV